MAHADIAHHHHPFVLPQGQHARLVEALASVDPHAVFEDALRAAVGNLGQRLDGASATLGRQHFLQLSAGQVLGRPLRAPLFAAAAVENGAIPVQAEIRVRQRQEQAVQLSGTPLHLFFQVLAMVFQVLLYPFASVDFPGQDLVLPRWAWQGAGWFLLLLMSIVLTMSLPVLLF